jgi:zinc D-Ala-D-Ala dipeptidase
MDEYRYGNIAEELARENLQMKPYQKIVIEECHEPLLPLSADEFALVTPHVYMTCGADYGGKSPYFLRQGSIERLRQAQQHLQTLRPGWRLQIFDAYRPVEVQQYMVNYTFQQVLVERGLQNTELSTSQTAAIWQQVYQIWAIPSFDLATPPPHSTGAAIDLTLLDAVGNVVDMGSPIDEMSPRSQPDYFATDPQGQIFHQQRELLRQVMTAAGFERHPGEWWHFSWGDQLWAWIYQENNGVGSVVAHYGRFIK